MLTDGKQIAAARQLLGWSQADLADKAGVSKPSIIRMEKDLYSVKDDMRRAVEITFDSHNMEFTPRGVQEKMHKIIQYDGQQGFRDFMWDVYNTCSDLGGDIRLFNARPEYWYKWLGAEWYQGHSERMQTIADKTTFHAISREGDDLFIANSFGEYRWFPKELFSEKAFYAYGNKLGFLNFEKETLNIVVIEHVDFANAFRVLFEIAWDTIAIIPPKKGFV
jgi:transcriptional regulator with XRE-family HTH domain